MEAFCSLTGQFHEPVKRIHDGQSLRLFQTSVALVELQKSLTRITQLVKGRQVPGGCLRASDLYTEEEIDKYTHSQDCVVPVFDDDTPVNGNDAGNIQSPYVGAVVSLLSQLTKLIDLVPPFPGPRRYGNMACREWHTKLESNINAWMHEYLAPLYKGDDLDGFINEVEWYLINAFGSKERLDYGTGHELNFLAFITGLWKVGIIPLSTVQGDEFLTMFAHYYNLARRLILTYTLEPAGSHGVWGLDDHFHIIYILGASQLLESSYSAVLPKFVNDRSVVFQYSSRNFYFNAIAFIYEVKKGPFFEHSPVLYDISKIKTWEKILKGMTKMYQAEVFGKFPVVQHFYTGGVLFPWRSSKDGSALPITTSDEDVSELKKKVDINDDWKFKVHHAHDPSRGTSTGSTSLQDQLIGNGSSQVPTRAPWAGVSTSTSVPHGSAQVTTKAPWAKAPRS